LLPAGRVNHLKEKAARSKLMDTERTSAKASGSGRTIVASLAALGSVDWLHLLPAMFPFIFAAGAAGSRRFFAKSSAFPPGWHLFSRSLLLLSEMASETVPMQTESA